MTASTTLETSTVCQSPKVESMGAFNSTQNSRIVDWYNKWNGPFRFRLTGIFGTSFEGGPLLPVSFHLTKLLSQYRSFVPCLQEQ